VDKYNSSTDEKVDKIGSVVIMGFLFILIALMILLSVTSFFSGPSVTSKYNTCMEFYDIIYSDHSADVDVEKQNEYYIDLCDKIIKQYEHKEFSDTIRNLKRLREKILSFEEEE